MKDRHILKFQFFYFIILAGIGCFTPYINVYLEQSIGLTGSQIGLITAVSLMIGVCIIPLWGIIGDKTRKYHFLLMISLVLTIVMLYFYSRQTVYIGCLIFALLLEVVRLGTMPMSDTIAMNYTAKTNGNYGSIRGMGSLGYMAGSMVVGFLADIFGLDGPLFTTYMILLGFGLLICLTFPKASQEENEEKPEKGNFKELIANHHFLFILVFIMLTVVVVDSAGKYAGNHLILTLHGNNSLISWLNFAQILPEFLFLMIASRVLQKTGYKTFFLLASIPMAIRMFTYALVPNAYIFVLVSIVHCLGVACSTVASLAFIKDSVHPSVFGTAVTLLNAAINIGNAIFGYLFGIIYQYMGSYQIFFASGIFVVIGVVMILTTHRFSEIDQKIGSEE